MGYSIKISKTAEKDFLTAKCYYAISDLETDFITDFKVQINYLKINPFLFQIYYRNVRRLHFNGFNYSIHYIVKSDVVYVLRILNHKQHYR